MKTHVQLVGILHIAMGVLALLGAAAVLVFVGMAGGIVASQGDHRSAGIIGIIAVALVAFLTLLALPGIIGGWALLQGRTWGRPVVLVLGALHLLHPPFGTALGIYTFWALLNKPLPESPIPAMRPIA